MNFRSKITIAIVVLINLTQIIAPPVNTKKKDEQHSTNDNDDLLNLHYGQYLQQIVELLEQDSAFKNKLKNATQDEIMSGGIAKELQFVSHGVRSKLDEVKRMEINRLRQLARQKEELSHGIDRKQAKISNHLNDENYHTFEVEDLKRLIVQATKDIAEADEKRRKEFKEYEMEKERDRVERLNELDKEQREKAEEVYQEQIKKHRDHPKLHHPGTKEQFKEVWEKEDQLPGDEFNLKTFFRMHDFDNDGKWSIDEVNAIFQTELRKMYDANATEDDMNERMEEMQRMREHMFKESDTDRDDMISFHEFEEYSKRQEYNEDPGWQGLDEQQMYTREEYNEYVKQRQEELSRMDPDSRHYWDSPPYYPPGVHPGVGMPPMPPQGYPHPGNYPQEYQQPGMQHQPYQQQQQQPGMQQQPYQHQQQQQQPQFQQHHQQQQFQQHPNVPVLQQNQHVPIQQHQQQQIPVQHQQIPVQHQQVPVQHQQVPVQQHQVPVQQQQTQQIPIQEQKNPNPNPETNTIK